LEDIHKYASETETFVAIKAYIDNWRWKYTPFYLRTGKRMPKRYYEIIISFKSVKHNVFDTKETIPGNKLIIRLQPEERIELVQMTKVPGPGGYRYKPISLKLDYMDSFNERLPEAYERLLVDVLRGNQTLFMRQDELEAAWQWIESITDGWKKAGKKNEDEDYNYFGDIHTKEILDDLGLTRYCCRRMLLSTSDLMNII
jgi:glucose-6-phosphate 1-dehydrogenase